MQLLLGNKKLESTVRYSSFDQKMFKDELSPLTGEHVIFHFNARIILIMHDTAVYDITSSCSGAIMRKNVHKYGSSKPDLFR